MIAARAPEETSSKAREVPGKGWTTLANFFGESGAMGRGPQAFLVTTPPQYVIKPHFHAVEQFQVAVRGGGMLGNVELRPATIQYADRFVPYGPIVSADAGLAFFTLRSRSDVGAHYMPEQRGDLPPRREERRTFKARTVLERPSTRDEIVVRVMIGPHVDELAAYEFAAGPDTPLPDEIVGGSGRYQIVLAGELVVQGRSMPVDSCIWASAGERLVGRCSGPNGLHLVQLQLPS